MQFIRTCYDGHGGGLLAELLTSLYSPRINSYTLRRHAYAALFIYPHQRCPRSQCQCGSVRLHVQHHHN